ncbi:hypothetical protein ACIQNU_17245 [Streptomyces sp. NPDC091292]|uniref:hypothetical protein n=1 Tax=Streptomyces sp. NPDC091292 TaxID=3365991 RepID=UPI0038261F13
MNGAAVRVGVGTRLKYDGEVVVVEEMFGSAAGNELLVRDGADRRFRLSLRVALSSGRATVIATGPGPEVDDDGETASVLFALLSEEELAEVRERAAHVNEVLTGFRSGSEEAPQPGEPRPQYAVTVPKLQRYETKATEVGVSVRTIKRWVRAFLDRHHLAHEPLTWQPPTTLLDGFDLPGCDPHAVALARLHQLIRGPSQSPTAAAQKLDTMPEVVRYLLALHPAPTTQRAAHGWRPNAALRYAREALPPDPIPLASTPCSSAHSNRSATRSG